MTMISMGRRLFAGAFVVLLVAACMQGAASAEAAKKPFRVVTTFTVIQDIA
jgi:ABC-type Zn uptake system ZnuABC Zn-binding protein ZnuA